MKNYSNQNLIYVNGNKGNLAIKVGNDIFPVKSNKQNIKFYKCASVNTTNYTWTGYKAILSGGIYSFESTVTSGLTYESWLTPEVGKVYDSNALVKASLYQGIQVGNIFNAPLTSNQTSSGDTITVFSEQVTFNSSSDGIAGAYLHDGGSLKYPLSNVLAQFTLSGWVKYTGSTTGWFIVIGHDSYNRCIGFGCPQYPGYTNIGYGGAVNSEFFAVDVNVWHHYALVRNGSLFLLYVDGVLAISHTNSDVNVTNNTLYIGCNRNGSGDYPIYLQPGYYSNIRIHSWALSAAEIAQLAAERSRQA